MFPASHAPIGALVSFTIGGPWGIALGVASHYAADLIGEHCYQDRKAEIGWEGLWLLSVLSVLGSTGHWYAIGAAIAAVLVDIGLILVRLKILSPDAGRSLHLAIHFGGIEARVRLGAASQQVLNCLLFVAVAWIAWATK